MILVRAARGAADTETARMLMREYQEFLERSLGEEHVCHTTLEQELAALPAPYDQAPGVLLLAFAAEKAAGCAGLRVRPNDALEMKRLWVRPAFRGQGAGRALVAASIDHARDERVREIVLDTVPAAMPEALALYRAMNFEEIPEYASAHVPGSVCLRVLLEKVP